jgi:hypothetical protein
MDSLVTVHVDRGETRPDAVGTLGEQTRPVRPETTTVEVASLRLGIGRSLGYQLAREGRFPCRVIRAGRRLLVPTVALERLLAADHTEVVTNEPTAQIA